MGKDRKNNNDYVAQLDNTRINRPIIPERVKAATPSLRIASYLKVYGEKELPKFSSGQSEVETGIARDNYLSQQALKKHELSVKEKKLLARDYVGFVPGIGDMLDFGITGYEVVTDLAPPVMLGLSAIGFIPWLGDAASGSKKILKNTTRKIALGIDPKKVDEYILLRDMQTVHPIYRNQDINFIEDNVLREISWIPNTKIPLSNNTFTTVQNAVRRMNEPLYQNALAKYLVDLRRLGNLDLLDQINDGIKRAMKAKRVVNEDAVRTFLSYFSIPPTAAENDLYDFLREGVAGITIPENGKVTAYVRKPTEALLKRTTTPLHEGEHVYQMLMSPTGKWEDALTLAQLDLYNKVYQTLPNPKYTHSASIVEKSATNKELLRLISDMYYNEYGTYPNYWLLNEYITNLPEEKLINLFKNPVNGYHQDYLDFYNALSPDPNFIRNFKNILKFGPMLASPLLIKNDE